MSRARWIVLWLLVISGLVVVEVAELTRLFRIPIQSALGDPAAIAFALVFTTILALIGAFTVGIYISQLIRSPRGFSPFEEEMLHMRADLVELRRSVDQMSALLQSRETLGDGLPAPPSVERSPPGKGSR